LQNKAKGLHISIVNARFTIKAEEGDPGAKARVNKKGVTVWEKTFGTLEGRIMNMSVQDGTFGKQLNVKIKGDRTEGVLHIQFDSMNALRLIGSLHAVDIDKPVTIDITPETYESKATGDMVQTSSIHVSQDGGRWVKLEWNKENPGDLPDLKKVKFKGQLVTDNSERLEFLEKYVADMEWDEGPEESKPDLEVEEVETPPKGYKAPAKAEEKPKGWKGSKKSSDDDDMPF